MMSTLLSLLWRYKRYCILRRPGHMRKHLILRSMQAFCTYSRTYAVH